MDSEKAAGVRDALNGLPCVVHDPEPSQTGGYDDLSEPITGGSRPDYKSAGARIRDPCRDFAFQPAEINEAGQVAFGEDTPKRPCYEVLLRPLTFATRPLPTISIPPSVVHEVAKYDCRLRVTAGLRSDFTPGTVRVRDDLAHSQNPESDGDRCPDCRGTRFKLKDGVPECERCGTRLEDKETTHEPTLSDYALS